jgi:hypothetical protein
VKLISPAKRLTRQQQVAKASTRPGSKSSVSTSTLALAPKDASKGYATLREAKDAVYAFVDKAGFPDPVFVESGHGLHVYWFLEESISAAEWKPRARGLKALCKQHDLKAPRGEHDKKAREKAREAYVKANPKFCMDIREDEPAEPVMLKWDSILLKVDKEEPPMRDVDGWPTEVRDRRPSGLRELTAAGVNDEEEETSRLPAPKLPLLSRHNK